MLRPARLHSFQIHGHALLIQDDVLSTTPQIVASELYRDIYRLQVIDFQPGDTVLDIGGHIGMFSIYLAKRFPFLKIIAYEPVPENAGHFRANLIHNQIKNVSLFEAAVTADGRSFEMKQSYHNTGCATAVSYLESANLELQWLAQIPSFQVNSFSPLQIWREHALQRCKLLKIDCEGFEYEILMQTPLLSAVDYLAGEVHSFPYLRARGLTPQRLQEHCEIYLPAERICFSS